MSTIKVDTIKNTSNVEVYTAKAWVNFDGTQTAANMIRSSGNVSSITDNGTGDYTVNFDVAMPDANYAIAGACGGAGGTSTSSGVVVCTPSSGSPIYTVSGVQIQTFLPGGGATDRPYVSLFVIR